MSPRLALPLLRRALHRQARRLALGAAAIACLALAGPALFDCTLTSMGIAPLNDLGPGIYAPGTIGGLYPNGMNTRPAAHLAAGRAIATGEIVPRLASGAPDFVNGKIGLLSVGMSNTTQEFNGGAPAFKPRADADPAKNPKLVIVDGAQGGKAADAWADAADPLWGVVASRVSAAGLSPAQVQVAWVKLAEKMPGTTYGAHPAHTAALQAHLATVLSHLVAAYPNLRIAYLSSRTRAYTSVFGALNPEPFAYESGFSVRGVIAQQLAGAPSLDYSLPSPAAPWLSWGPYLWADGATPRSDGFTWHCGDTQPDFTHPSPAGVQKVADQLLAFFKTDPTATPWFLRPASLGSPPLVTTAVSAATGAAPLAVSFTASATDPDGTIGDAVWTFDDGGFARVLSPAKIFPAPGLYEAHLTVTDDLGNTTRVARTISVRPAAANPWLDVGAGLAGVAGTPSLSGTGSLAGGSPIGLHLSGAKAGAPVVLVIGLTALDAPFKGGTLVPSPDVLLAGLSANAQGLLALGGAWPTGIPSGLSFFFQEWIADAAAPAGFSATNGLRGTTP